MGFRDWFTNPWTAKARNADGGTMPSMALSEVLERYNVVDVVNHDGHAYMVVSDPTPSSPLLSEAPPVQYNGRGEVQMKDHATGKKLAVAPNAVSSMGELGTSSPSPFTSFTRQEYNPELRGYEGLKRYDRMRRSDGTVRGTLRLVKTPVLSARWFVEAASDKPADKKAAEFVWKCLTEYMSITWTQVLTEALLMCEYGYYMFEKVWDIRIIDGHPRIVWKKLAPRHPMDVKEWHYDQNGGPAGVSFYPPTMDVNEEEIHIPIEKLAVFSFDREAGNIEGMSILRSAYKHWYYKEQLYKIDAIQKERHGIGVPVIKLPPGYTKDDRLAADNLGRNLRTNERAHVVLPPQWELLFAKIEGQPVDVLKSIEHHDRLIEKNVLARFLGEKGGSGEDDQNIFLKGTRFIADIVADTFNVYCIPQLVDYNFTRGLTGYPKLRARRIGEHNDWRTMSFSVRNLIGAGALTPDDELEAFLRSEMDLPLMDPKTARDVRKPQAPGSPVPKPPGTPAPPGTNLPHVGPPRQVPPNPKPVGQPQAGQDRSGG